MEKYELFVGYNFKKEVTDYVQQKSAHKIVHDPLS